MLQVAEWILRDPSDATKVSLVFANGGWGGGMGGSCELCTWIAV
jgi:hypothetical protein